jgi:mxaJ protein
MSSHCRNCDDAGGLPVRLFVGGRFPTFAAFVLCFFAFVSLAAAAPRVLRVAADPNNLPFSNERREGFENKIVELVAHELGATVEYTWWAQRRGFFRNTLKSGQCDLVAGVPRGFEMALTTEPYYRSTYVLVTRRELAPPLASLDDPRLRSLRIGVQMIGDDFANTPPEQALSRRGIVANVRGYTLYGDYAKPNPPARILDALLAREIDVACVWGPLAGFFVREHPRALALTPLPPNDPATDLPFAYAIAMGVRRSNRALRDEIQAVLDRKRGEIDAILASYNVPRADVAAPGP